MKPMLTKKFAELADVVESTVPSSGKFEPKFASFEDETKSLDIVYWSVVVRDLISHYRGDALNSMRYIELRGYLSYNYCGTIIVGSGSVEECAAQLRSHDLVVHVMESMKRILSSAEID